MSDVILDMDVFTTTLDDADAFVVDQLKDKNGRFLVHLLALLQLKLQDEPDYKDMFAHAQLSYKHLLRREKLEEKEEAKEAKKLEKQAAASKAASSPSSSKSPPPAQDDGDNVEEEADDDAK